MKKKKRWETHMPIMFKRRIIINECKHEFVHAKIETWFAAKMTIYCKHCGIDRDKLYPKTFTQKIFDR